MLPRNAWVLRFAQDDSHKKERLDERTTLRLYRHQVGIAGLRNVAAEAALVAAVVSGERDLLEVSTRDSADHMHRAIICAYVDEAAVRCETRIERYGIAGQRDGRDGV